MGEPQLPLEQPLTGTVNGRGWSDDSAWSLTVVGGGLTFRCDDDAHPELWLQFEVLPSQMPALAMIALRTVVCGPAPQTLGREVLEVLTKSPRSFCNGCGDEIECERAALFCCRQCFKAFCYKHIASDQKFIPSLLSMLEGYVNNG